MQRNFPFWTKAGLVFGLNLFFYPIQVWVNNLDALQYPTLKALLTEGRVMLLHEYFFGSVAMLIWFLMAEWMLGAMERLFGDFQLGKGIVSGLFRGLTIFLIIIVLYGMFELATRTVFLLEQLHGAPNPVLAFRDEYHYRRFRFGFSLYAIFGLLIFYLMTYRRIFRQMADARLRMEKAEHERRENQYAALRHQVNPHFLFNSLSTLSSLAPQNPDLAEQFIDRLSRAYRYMLESREEGTVPLKQELAFFDAIAFLYKCRFGSKVQIQTAVPEAVADSTGVVPLSLQIVAEHIFRHQRMSLEKPLQIRIGVDGDDLVVENSRQPRSAPDPATGAGLQVLESRYLALTDRFVRFGERQGACVCRLPLVPKTDPNP